MSIKLDINNIPLDKISNIKKGTVIKVDKNCISVLRKENEYLYVPLALAIRNGFTTPETSFYPFKHIPEFSGALREAQQEVETQAVNMLQSNNSLIMSCYTGFGKTITSISIACKLQLKTLIVVTRVLLMTQWKEALEKVCKGCVAEIITSASKNDFVVCDFGIINAQTICKMDVGCLQSFGTIIIDESHLVLSLKTFTSLLFLTPKYLLALSATSYRNDELNVLFPIFFGTKMLKRDLFRKHTVMVVKTGFKPEIKNNVFGKIDWNVVLESQASSIERNTLIVNIVKKFPTKNFLILVKRIKQGEWLAEALKEEKVSTLFGSNQKYDENCRILIGTNSKIGTGFDFDKLDTLILGADVVDYYIQFIGRIMRRVDTDPWIFDLVDDNPIMKSHFVKRKKIYMRHGGVLQNYSMF